MTGTASGVMGAYYASCIRTPDAWPLSLVVEQGHEMDGKGTCTSKYTRPVISWMSPSRERASMYGSRWSASKAADDAASKKAVPLTREARLADSLFAGYPVNSCTQYPLW